MEHATWRSWQYDDYPRDRQLVIEFLDQCKAKVPDFKATIFAVPQHMRRRDWEPLHARRDWLQVGPHGFNHDKWECREERLYRDKLPLLDHYASDPAWAKVFKAGWWSYDQRFLQELAKRKFAVGIACLSDDYGYPPVDIQSYCWNDWLLDTPKWQHWGFHPRATRPGEFKMSKTSIDDIARQQYLDSLKPNDRFEFVADKTEPMCVKINLGCGNQVWPGWQCFDRRDDKWRPGVRKWEWPERIPYTCCRADIVLMSHMMEYIPDEHYEDLFLDVWRVLRPCGILRISDLDNGFQWKPIGSERTRGTGRIESSPNYQRIRQALQNVGFQVFRSRPGFTLSPHTDVLQGDTRARVYRRGHKFYAEAVKAVQVREMKRVRYHDPHMTRDGRYYHVNYGKLIRLFFRQSKIIGNRREIVE